MSQDQLPENVTPLHLDKIPEINLAEAEYYITVAIWKQAKTGWLPLAES